MKPLDRVLDRVQRQVELEGRSHAECVYLSNQSFQVPSNQIPPPPREESLEIDQLNKLKDVVYNLRSDNMWTGAILFCGGIWFQFMETDTTIDVTVTFPQADVYNNLEKLLVTTSSTLRDLCLITNDVPGLITVNVGYMFARYQDMVYVEENTIEYGE